MNRGLDHTVALGVGFALGACSDGTGSLPTAESAASLVGSGPACSPTDLKKATEMLFGRRSAEATIAANFKPSTANTEAVTPYAYALFAAIAALRNGTAWSADLTDEAALLAVHITACSKLAFSDPGRVSEAQSGITAASLAAAFTGALAEDGTFEVRGSPYNAFGDVISHDLQAGISPPVIGYDAWLGGLALILGTPIPGFMPATFSNEIPGGGHYDWYMLRPSGATLNGLATVAVCTPDSPSGLGNVDPLRLQHLATSNSGNIIPFATWQDDDVGDDIVCSTYAAAPSWLGARLLAAVGNALLPQTLHAALAGGGPVGGLLGSFSPVAAVYPEQMIVTFSHPPVDGFVNVPIPVEVTVTGAQGTPWEDVLVTLSPVANDGQPLMLCGDTATTDVQGIAAFPNFRVSKAGGLFVTASVTEPSEDPDVIAYFTTAVADSSDRFNVRPTVGTPIPCP